MLKENQKIHKKLQKNILQVHAFDNDCWCLTSLKFQYFLLIFSILRIALKELFTSHEQSFERFSEPIQTIQFSFYFPFNQIHLFISSLYHKQMTSF